VRFSPIELVKLPKCAQHRITALEADLARAKMIETQMSEKTSRVSFGYEEPVYLPEREVYMFRLGDDWHSVVRVTISKNHKGQPALDINAGGTVVVMATHDLDLVRQTSYRIIELRDGSLVYDTEVDEAAAEAQ